MSFKYRNVVCLILLSCSLILYTDRLLAVPKYPITNFTPDDYKGGIQNIDFAQNRAMNIYVANNLGVLSFNGDTWVVHARDTGKKQRSLEFDPVLNRLYVGSQGEFGYFEADWKYISLSSKLPANAPSFDEVWEVFIHEGKVYFCTFQGIFVFDGQKLDIITNELGFNRSFNSGQEVFTQNSEGKLFKLEGGSLIPSIAQDHQNSIVAGVISSSNGYHIFYNSGDIEFSTANKAEPAYENLSNRLKGNYVNHVLTLSDNRIVISTQRAGLFLYNPKDNSIENINSIGGLQSNACLRAFQDYNGNLWVGMQSGMALIDIKSPLKLINQESNLQGSGYEAFETKTGNYYTTSNGIFYLGRNQEAAKFLDGTAGPAYGMTMIEGKLYAGHHTGLFLLSNGRARRIYRSEGLWEVKRLKSNPDYAIGGSYKGIHLFRINPNDELESLGRIKGFEESSRFFEEDLEGKIWVSQFYKGIYRLELSDDLKSASVSKISDSFKDVPIQEHAFLSRIDNEIYFGTEQGIYKLDQITNEIIKENKFDEVIGNSWVYFLGQDRENNVHVYTKDVVGYFKRIGPENYKFVHSSGFRLKQSFNNDLIKISVNVSEGVYFNSNEGFISYYPALQESSVSDKKPLFTLVKGENEDENIYFKKNPFDKMPDEIEEITVEDGIRVLQFKVESFDYSNVGNKQYRYLLKGFEDEYGNWTSATIKEYTNLNSGAYQLFAQTVNAQGQLITSEPLLINIKPAFYKSDLGKLLLLITIVTIIIFGYYIQRRYYKQKVKSSERVKEEEINKKQNELQRLKQEKVDSELRHVNNLLAASTMNLVVKNEFMEHIKNAIKQVSVDKDIKSTKKELAKIIKEIDTTLKVQEDWKQFEFHFDKVHGDFLKRLTSEFTDLTPGEQKLCAFLRLKMDTKEVANLLGISLRGVEVARYRLRKKLELQNYQNLSKFILEY